MRQGGCCEFNGWCLPKPSPVHSPEQSKRLYFVTLEQLVRGFCPGEQPTRPRSYQLIQRPCRNFLLCDLGLANSTAKLRLSHAPLGEMPAAPESLAAGALQCSEAWA